VKPWAMKTKQLKPPRSMNKHCKNQKKKKKKKKKQTNKKKKIKKKKKKKKKKKTSNIRDVSHEMVDSLHVYHLASNKHCKKTFSNLLFFSFSFINYHHRNGSHRN